MREIKRDDFRQYRKAEPLIDVLIECDAPLYDRSRSQVREILGDPDHRIYDGRSWVYRVGVPPDLSDYSGLYVSFDRRGRVIKVAVPGYQRR